MPAGMPNNVDDILMPPRSGGIQFVADDHGLGQEIAQACLVCPHVLAKHALAV